MTNTELRELIEGNAMDDLIDRVGYANFDAKMRIEVKTALSRLSEENESLKSSVIAFAGPWAAEWAEMHELPKGHLHPTHYDLLKSCGARMDDFTRTTLSGGQQG